MFDFMDYRKRFNNDERDLDRLEPAWAKASLYFRTGEHFGHNEEMRCQSLLKIHRQLEVQRKRYESGDSMALLHAVAACAKENLPLPSWLTLAFTSSFNRFLQPGGPVSLDDVFFSDNLPTTPTRAIQVRRDWQIGVKIWRAVWKIWEEHTSLDSALKAVLASGDYGVALTKARELVLAIDRNQFELLGRPHDSLEHAFEKKKKS